MQLRISETAFLENRMNCSTSSKCLRYKLIVDTVQKKFTYLEFTVGEVLLLL